MRTPCVQCKNFERGKFPNLKTCEIYEKLDKIDKTVALYSGVEDCIMFENKIKEKHEKKPINRKWVSIEPTGNKTNDALQLCKKAISGLSDLDALELTSELVKNIMARKK